jgi:hypothetical protein
MTFRPLFLVLATTVLLSACGAEDPAPATGMDAAHMDTPAATEQPETEDIPDLIIPENE